MFYIKEPSTLNSAWILSHCKDGNCVVPKDTLKDIKNYHVLGIDFLYQKYKREFKGTILNEEYEMNMQLQVSAFLNAMFNNVKKKFLVLVVSPDNLLVNWHYHLTTHGGLRVQIISSSTCPEDFDEESGLALLLSFSNMKLAESLVGYDYFSVIIDSFEEVATKLIIRKLNSNFNIGLTYRNFYFNPNQKLQWTALNWCNPGCVGKLGEFYEIDNDNFANFRDNYRHWWFRLTWNFCESFKKQTDEENQEYSNSLIQWTRDHNLTDLHVVKADHKSRKRKKIEIFDNPGKSNKPHKITKFLDTKDDRSDQNIVVYTPETNDSITISRINSESSNDTIIYEDTEVKKECEDKIPISYSNITNSNESPQPSHIDECHVKQPSSYEQDDVLLSIINGTDSGYPALDHEAQMSVKTEELFSEIFSSKPCTSRNLLHEDDNGFFQSLLEPLGEQVKSSGGTPKSIIDVDDILKETDLLLKD